MGKMWSGRFAKELDQAADDFNSSLRVDCRMYKEDIHGSLAHAAMLAAQGIISQKDGEAIRAGLLGIEKDLDNGGLEFDFSCEDIHMFIEEELTRRIGEAGKRLHTARSRNDQVAVDLRLYLRGEIAELDALLVQLAQALLAQAEKYSAAIMPGYTHLQRAQPITFGHHLLAYDMMLLRDRGRLADAARRLDASPLGCAALAGTTYAIDREMTRQELGFASLCANSLDGVSDRDYCLELMSACAIISMHLSRLAEEIILWSSWEFKFIELDDAFATGSSIMPQKKNPDLAELVRGKSGRVYGDLLALLTAMKGLPLAYNKDMQEDKEAVFDCVDTVKSCLEILTPLVTTLRPLPENMRRAASRGFINATDLADYLVGKGLAFRSAYKIVGELVARCTAENATLEDLPLAVYEEFSPLFAADVYEAINLEACVARRNSTGGPGPRSVAEQIAYVKERLEA